MGMADAAFKEGAHGSALKYLGELFTADAAYKEAQVYLLFAYLDCKSQTNHWVM